MAVNIQVEYGGIAHKWLSPTEISKNLLLANYWAKDPDTNRLRKYLYSWATGDTIVLCALNLGAFAKLFVIYPCNPSYVITSSEHLFSKNFTAIIKINGVLIAKRNMPMVFPREPTPRIFIDELSFNKNSHYIESFLQLIGANLVGEKINLLNLNIDVSIGAGRKADVKKLLSILTK